MKASSDINGLRRSIIEGAIAAVSERLVPTDPHACMTVWYDGVTNVEWDGPEVAAECERLRDEIAALLRKELASPGADNEGKA